MESMLKNPKIAAAAKGKNWSNTTIVAGVLALAVAAYGLTIVAKAIQKYTEDQTQLTIVTMTVPDPKKPFSAEITFTPDFDFSGFKVSIMGETDILPVTLNSWHSYFKINEIIAPNKINVEVPGLETPATKGKLLTHTNWDDAFTGAAEDTNEAIEEAAKGFFDLIQEAFGNIWATIITVVCVIVGIIFLVVLIKFIIKKKKISP